MIELNRYEFWFLTGSQRLYGENTLKQVAADARKREFGFITARMDIPRTVAAGHWSNSSVQDRIVRWMREGCLCCCGRQEFKYRPYELRWNAAA